MVKMEWLTGIVPEWLMQWLEIYVTPFLKAQLREMARALLLGTVDTILFFSLPLSLSMSSQAVWNARYHLTPAQQDQVETWASTAQLIAYLEDVPPVVPLVLWLKESGLQARNPSNCEGIMGLHTAVKTGQLPCFPPGDIGPREVAMQLRIGTRTFKEYCPEITYHTINPNVIRTCYLFYNAGPRSRMRPTESAYVMNGFDAEHENMILTDVRGRRYRLTALGAWPAHLAIQAQLADRGGPWAPRPVMAPLMLLQELMDRLWALRSDPETDVDIEPAGSGEPAPPADVTLDPSALICREPVVRDCFVGPAADEEEAWSPLFRPLQVSPVAAGPLECGLLPGLNLTPPKASLVLAPITGDLRRYSDGNGHLVVQIENETWTIWLSGLRAYTAGEGPVEAGAPVGAIGGAQSRTPAVHYAAYHKTLEGFVDPLSVVPSGYCPPDFGADLEAAPEADLEAAPEADLEAAPEATIEATQQVSPTFGVPAGDASSGD